MQTPPDSDARGYRSDTVVLTLLAALVAAPGIGRPAALIFDEVFYVSDAVSHLAAGVGQGFQAHPPLGTWITAAGIAVWGEDPTGWRLGALVLGIAAVPLLHRLALHLAHGQRQRRLLAAAATILLVADASWFVLSRTAMLDGPLTTLVLGATAAAARAGVSHDGRRRTGWAVVAGALAGAATAVKWSGALALPILAVALAVVGGARVRSALPRLVGVAAVAMATTYALAWAPLALHRGDVPIANCPAEAEPCAAEGGVRGVVEQHQVLIRYHTSVRFPGGYASPPAGWPLLQRPVALYRSTCDLPREPVPDPFAVSPSCPDDRVPGSDIIVYTGNPVTWFAFVALLPLLMAAARRRRPAAVVALVGWSVLWLPWLVATRSSFLFYMAPTVPFLALGTVAAAREATEQSAVPVLLRALAGGSAGAALAWLTPLSPALALLGWASGGAWGRIDARAPSVRATTVAVGLLVVGAVGAFIALRPTLVAS